MPDPLSRSTTTDDLGEFLMRTLTPVSSKKRPAYEAAKEARRMVIAEVVVALRAEAANWSSRSGEMARERGNSHRNHEDERATRLYFAADFIEREFGGQDGA